MIIYAGNKSFLESFRKNGVNAYHPYKSTNLLSSVLLKFFSKSIFINRILFNKEIVQNEDNYIIVFDTMITKQFLDILHKYKSNKKLIFWYWNPVKDSLKIQNVNRYFDIWSYSAKDCEMYGVKRNTTFYFESDIFAEYSQKKWDVIFIGKDKNRMTSVHKHFADFQKLGLKVYTHITSDSKWRISKHYNKPIRYIDTLKLGKQSKAILDYYNDIQAGISLRPIEAMLMGIKLITNNVAIVNEKIYYKSNIFIIGNDSRDLIDFLDQDFEQIDDYTKKYYSFISWLDRFFLEEEK